MGSKGGRRRRITKDRVLTVFQEDTRPFLTTGELVEQLPASRQAIKPRLDELMEDDELGGRIASNVWFYWIPGRVAEGPDKVVASDKVVLDLDDRLREDLEEHAEEEDTTPEKAAIELLAGGLEGAPGNLGEATKTVGAAFSTLMLASLVVQSRFSGVIEQVAFGLTGLALALFAALLVAWMMFPVVDPAVSRAQEWWAGWREE